MSRFLRGVMVVVALLVFVALVVAVTVFLYRNGHWVVIRVPTVSFSFSDPFPMVEYESPLAVVILGAFVAGGVLALLLCVPWALGRAVLLRREQRFIRGLEGELTDLRNLPLTGPAPLEDVEEPDRPRADRGRAARPPGRSGAGGPGREGEAEQDDEALLISRLQGTDQRGPGR